MIGLFWMALAFAEDCPKEPLVQVTGDVVEIRLCAGPKTPCADGCWAGATVRRSDAVIVDLEPVALTGEQVGNTVVLRGTVAGRPTEYMAAVWSDKAACDPAKNPRPGCKAFGVEFENAQWTWPAYNGDWFESWADVSPGRISVLDAGGGSALRDRAVAVLKGNQGGHDVLAGAKAGTARQHVEILYLNKWERTEAWQLAQILKEQQVGFRWTVKHWPEAPEHFVIAVGGP